MGGRWKAVDPNICGLDNGEAPKLGGKIRSRLERMGFRIPTILEIRDDHYIEGNIFLIESAGRIYVARVGWRCMVLETIIEVRNT